MASKNKKIATTVTAVAMAAVLAIGGTMAWQSISQEATNIVSEAVNPGGRLHDDFDGSNDKNIYVENFGTQNIYARVKLSEYLEIGPGAGDLTLEAREDYLNDGTISVLAGGNLEDKASYTTYYYGEENASDAYWTKSWGGETLYIPTFNMNQDSLEADLNGTYGYVNGENENDPYGDFIDINAAYAEGAEVTGSEVVDADTNAVDEGDRALEGTNITTTDNQTHNVAQSLSAKIITMDEWLQNSVSLTAADDPYGVAPAFATNEIAILNYDKNAADAEGSIAVEAPWGSEITLSDGTGFSREGYTLVGWNTSPEGDGTEYPEYILGEEGYVMPEGGATLYAMWQINTGVGDDSQQESQEGYWVYDTDGWAYWSQPIAPGTSTGLLLDSITDLGLIDEDYYYAIHVTGQFITAGDLGDDDGTGFYTDGEPTDEALALLKSIGVKVDSNDEGVEDPFGFSHMLLSPNLKDTATKALLDNGYAKPGDTVIFNVAAYYNNGQTIEINTENTNWTLNAVKGEIADGTSVNGGTITISDEQADLSVLEFEVTYTDQEGTEYSKSDYILVSETKITLSVELEEKGPYYTDVYYTATASATNESGDIVPMEWKYDLVKNENDGESSISVDDNNVSAAQVGTYEVRAWAEYMWGQKAVMNIDVVQNTDSGTE